MIMTILEIMDRLVILTIVCWRARSRGICCTARAGNRCIFTPRGPLSLDAPQSTWRTLSFSSWNGLRAWFKSGCRVIALSLMECRGCPSFKACATDTLRFRTFYPLHACYMALLFHSAFIMESLYILRYVHFNFKIVGMIFIDMITQNTTCDTNYPDFDNFEHLRTFFFQYLFGFKRFMCDLLQAYQWIQNN